MQEGFEGELYRKLEEYSKSGRYAFHMPGHKRLVEGFENPFKIDITEIDGFDDLNHPKPDGVLTRAQERAAALYGASETHFLVNGSTAGILTAVRACTRSGDRLLMARNCHRSVYNAAELCMLEPVYVYPAGMTAEGITGPVAPAEIEKRLISSDAAAVVLTSPTYDGVCSDVRAAAAVCHKYGKPLIVDQAHGAHLAFSDYFPEDALKAGADLVIHSLHKTLPSLTQTGLLHIQGNLVDRDKVRRYLSVFQTSSPSYVLMASIDSCVTLIAEHGRELFEEYTQMLDEFRKACAGLNNLRLEGKELLESFPYAGRADFDRSRLVVTTPEGLPGPGLMSMLRGKYGVEFEMSAPRYVLGISGPADTKEGFERLYTALLKEDAAIGRGAKRIYLRDTLQYPEPPEAVLKPWEVDAGSGEDVLLQEAEGRISAEYIYLYPPGTPMLVPGERISRGTAAQIQRLQDGGFTVQGVKDGKTLLCDREKQRR